MQALKNPTPTALAPSSGFTDFILHQLRVAAIDAKIVANEIETTIAALSAGLISVEAAIVHLHQFGLVEASS